MKFFSKKSKKKCALCKEKKPKEHMKSLQFGLYLCDDCNNPEKKQEVLDQLKGTPFEKLVKK
jgi:uncharacterized protein YjaZ